MAKTREAKVRDPVVEWAKARMIPYLRRTVLPGTSQGWPDDQFMIPGGRSAFIEFKAPGETPKPLQTHRMKTLKELGYHVAWFDNTATAIEWLERCIRENAEG